MASFFTLTGSNSTTQHRLSLEENIISLPRLELIWGKHIWMYSDNFCDERVHDEIKHYSTYMQKRHMCMCRTMHTGHHHHVDHIDWTLPTRLVQWRNRDYWQTSTLLVIPYHLFLISVDSYHDRFQWEILILFQLSSAMLCHSCFFLLNWVNTTVRLKLQKNVFFRNLLLISFNFFHVSVFSSLAALTTR